MHHTPLRAITSPRSRPVPIGAAVLFLLAAVMLALAPPAGAGHVDAPRVGGEDRFHTAAEVARSNFPVGGVETAVLASGRAFPDALAASFASSEVAGLRAPVLLTEPTALPSHTLVALDDLGVEEVVIVGGPDAVSFDVGADLEARGYEVERLHGPDRFETASVIAQSFGPVGEIDGQRTAIVASGNVFPDALSAGPLSAGEGFPLLLTNRDAVPQPTWSALAGQEIDLVLIVGGEQVVSAAVAEALADEGYEVERVAGLNRQETATAVADFASERLGWTVTQVLLATDLDFPDALAAASYGGRLGFPVVLADVPPAQLTESWLRDRCPTIDTVRAIGGENAISPEWHLRMANAADDCPH